MKHLFSYWNAIEPTLAGKKIVLSLDFDGTLADIASSPKKARLSLRTKRLLKKLVSHADCQLAIISGRALKDVQRVVGMSGLVYAGNHGLELIGPGLNFRHPLPMHYRTGLISIKQKLNEDLKNTGVFLEDKGLSLSLHYRGVSRFKIPFVKRIFEKVIYPYIVKRKIKVKSGKMVFEIKPPVSWDKGKIILWLLQQKSIRKIKSVIIYVGDDTTDEDAFKALQKRGLTVKVGRTESSQAQYYLKNSQQVRQLLKKVDKYLKFRKAFKR